MKPAWTKLEKKFAGSDIVVGNVDCTASHNKQLCKDNGVRGYPTVKYFQNGKWQKYSGGRDYDALEKHTDNLVKDGKGGSTSAGGSSKKPPPNKRAPPKKKGPGAKGSKKSPFKGKGKGKKGGSLGDIFKKKKKKKDFDPKSLKDKLKNLGKNKGRGPKASKRTPPKKRPPKRCMVINHPKDGAKGNDLCNDDQKAFIEEIGKLDRPGLNTVMLNLKACMDRGEHSEGEGAAKVDCPVTEVDYQIESNKGRDEFNEEDLPFVKAVITQLGGEVTNEDEKKVQFKAAPMNRTEETKIRKQLQKDAGKVTINLRRSPPPLDKEGMEAHKGLMMKLGGVREKYRLAKSVRPIPAPNNDL